MKIFLYLTDWIQDKEKIWLINIQLVFSQQNNSMKSLQQILILKLNQLNILKTIMPISEA